MSATGEGKRRLTTLGRSTQGWPQWSPDGSSIFVLSSGADGAALHRVPLAGGRPQRIALAQTVTGPGALSPDGKWFAYSAIERGWAFLEIVPTAGGAPRRIAPRSDRVWNTRPLWSPDGSKVAISDWQFDDDATENIVEYSVSDGSLREVTNRPNSYEVVGAYLPDGRLVYTAAGITSWLVRVSVTKLLADK
jgi:Tol biopolymer transport system component